MAAPTMRAATTSPMVSRLASFWKPRMSSASSKAWTLRWNVPSAMASMTLLTRPGSCSTKSRASSRAREGASRRRAHLALHHLTGVRLDRRAGVERGIERAGDLVEVEQGLAEHGELGRQAQPVVAGDAHQLHDHRAGVDLARGFGPGCAPPARDARHRTRRRRTPRAAGRCRWRRRPPALPSPSLRASSSLTSSFRMPAGTRATMPRSIRASRPSSVSRTLPGWGSAWKKPSTRIWSR